MKKYEVIRVDYSDKTVGLKVGDIVEFKRYDEFPHLVQVKLPKHLHGKGHRAFRYKNRNYWLLEKKKKKKNQLKEIE